MRVCMISSLKTKLPAPNQGLSSKGVNEEKKPGSEVAVWDEFLFREMTLK